jgi:hypothetical protein
MTDAPVDDAARGSDRDARGPGEPGRYEPPWREARRRVAGAWARGRRATRIGLALAGALAAALLGAFVFGLWHVVVGGFLKGNWNAGGFGIALASVAGVLLWIEAAVARRLLPPAPGGSASS